MPQTLFVADHIERSHTIELRGSREEIFPLFTPLGETDWVPGWDPTFHHPRSGELAEGGIFTTSQDGEPDTIWAVMECEPARVSGQVCESDAGLPRRDRRGPVRRGSRGDDPVARDLHVYGSVGSGQQVPSGFHRDPLSGLHRVLADCDRALPGSGEPAAG